MIIGETKSGFKFEIEESALDDWELLSALADVDEGKIGMVTKIPKMLLGEDQAKELVNHLRESNGRVPASKMSEAIKDILESSKELKN